jgi:hypothetical protein
MFGKGEGNARDLQALKLLIDRRAVLLAPPTPRVSSERLRAIGTRLKKQAEEIREAVDGKTPA